MTAWFLSVWLWQRGETMGIADVWMFTRLKQCFGFILLPEGSVLEKPGKADSNIWFGGEQC